MTTSFDFTYLDTLDVLPAGRGRLFLQRDGLAATAPTILFVHGAFHGAWCYAAWMRDCAANGISTAAVDVIGHGGLPVTDDLRSAGVRDFASDVVAAVRKFAVPPILVGHSLGGLIVGLVAAQTPLSGLVLLTPSPPGNLPGAAAVPGFDESVLLPLPSEARVRDAYMPNHADRSIDAVMARLSPESPTAMNDRYLLRVPVDREAISCPALCIAAGRDSPVTHPPGQDFAVGDFYGAENIELPEAAHSLMLDVDRRAGLDVVLAWRARHFTQ